MPKKRTTSTETISYSDGSRTEIKTDYYKNGKPRRVVVTDFDSTDNPTNEKTTWLSSNGTITDTSETVTEYHSNGKTARKFTTDTYGPDHLEDREFEDVFDKKGRLKKRTVKVHYRDRMGRKIKTRTSILDNSKEETFDQEYDPETGRKIGIPEEVPRKKSGGLHPLWH